MHKTGSVLFGIFSVVSALVLNPDLQLLSPSTRPDNVSRMSETNRSGTPVVLSNSTHVSEPTDPRQMAWRCSDLLGHGAFAASCEEAARHMAFVPRGAHDSRQFEWGGRDTPVAQDIPLPQEVVSSDGQCRINVHMRGRNPWSVARASQSQVQAGVSLAIQNCMRNQARPVGGSVWKISDDGLLEVWVILSDESPPTYGCYGTMRPDAEASCKWILDRIPAEGDLKTNFGSRTDPGVEVQLPWAVQSPDHRCALTVRTAGPSDSAYWGALWEGAVELASICARHGMQGRKVRLGDDHYLAIFLTDPSARDVNLS